MTLNTKWRGCRLMTQARIRVHRPALKQRGFVMISVVGLLCAVAVLVHLILTTVQFEQQASLGYAQAESVHSGLK